MRNVLAPQAGKASTTLTVRKWFKAVGQTVAKGETIAQLESQDGLVELSAAEAGVLTSIAVQKGQSAKVGALLAQVDEAGTEPRRHGGTEAPSAMDVSFTSINTDLPQKAPVSAGKLSAQMEDPAMAPPSASVPLAPSVANSSANVTPIIMPQAGNSMEEGTVVKWHVKEGDRITVGQVIFEIETDKANMEVEATDAGRLARIVTPEGGVQKVKEPVAFLAENDADLPSAGAKTELPQNAPAAPAGKLQPQKQDVAPPAPSAFVPLAPSVAISPEGRLKASPAARKLAQEKHLDLASVGAGSGPGGRILSTDLARAATASAKPESKIAKPDAKEIAPLGRLATTEIVRTKMSKMRKAIAANLLQSKQTIPHFYLRSTVNADAMMAFYKGEKAKYPCSVNDVVTLACAKAIVEFPALRSKLDKDEIVEYPTVNIGVAVGVEDGLTVPVLLNAHEMNLQQIAAETKRIVQNARNGKLEDYGQGNFTITNLGMFGVEEFAAIVNPPEPAILAVGAAREAVIVKDGFMKPGRVMTMTLSCDHRVVDGLLAAKFMARVKELLENPTILG